MYSGRSNSSVRTTSTGKGTSSACSSSVRGSDGESAIAASDRGPSVSCANHARYVESSPGATGAQPFAEPRMATASAPVPTAGQTLGTNFLGAELGTDSAYVPPDSMGAVGPSQFLLGVNGRVRTFSKDGTPDGVLNT